jgi:hypothetical protein
MLPQEELARIDELALHIGPAFKAAMQRSGERGDIKKWFLPDTNTSAV